jgi:SAM-dependent methyltransferase
MRWQIRLAKNTLIGLLPLSMQERIARIGRHVIQDSCGEMDWTLEQGLRQVEMLRSSGFDIQGKDTLELGSGWRPVIPLIFYVAGCKRIMLVDLHRQMDKKLLIGTCLKVLEHKDKISSRLGISSDEVEAKLSVDSSLPFEIMLRKFGFEYLAPFDILSDNITQGSLDIITSNAVLEHIPQYLLPKIFDALHRCLKEGGAMCHIIDNSDHWAHGDKTISHLNFLRFSNGIFSFISGLNPSSNPINCQNRLRHVQYRDMMEKASFKIVLDESVADKNALKRIGDIKVHSDFTRFSPYELAILTSYIVASKQ